MSSTTQVPEVPVDEVSPADDAEPLMRREVAVTVIEHRSTWQLVDWKELREYSDLFRFLVWRAIRIRFAQSALGIGWAILQPLFSMGVFTIVFGNLAKVSSDGVPYAIFSFTALVPWTYFSNSVTAGTGSLISNANMISKIYFPRLLLPMSEVTAKLVDFFITLLMLAVLLVVFGMTPNWGVVVLPLLAAIMILTAAGVSTWLTALAIQYRDIKYAITFMMQIVMYASPVIYPASLIPRQYQWIYAINPMVGVIEGFRAALLNTRDMPWDFIGIGLVSSVAVALTGVLYFRRREEVFADVA